MSTVKGRGRNVEIAVDRALPAAGEELRAHFTERPDFYRGSHAVANLGLLEPGAPEIAAFRDLLAEFGITLDGVSGADTLADVLANSPPYRAAGRAGTSSSHRKRARSWPTSPAPGPTSPSGGSRAVRLRPWARPAPRPASPRPV